MKERLEDFKGELQTVTSEELEMLPEKAFATWLKKWAKYLKDGGVRPGHPH